MASEDVETRIWEVKLASMVFREPSMSKLKWRILANAFEWFMKYGVILFIAAIAGYSVAYTLLGG